MKALPLCFCVHTRATSGISSRWTTQSDSLPALEIAIPTEFDGPGGALSPEDLFAQALTQCWVGTFKVYAEKSHLSYSNLEVRAQLFVDKSSDQGQQLIMRRFATQVRISGVSDVKKARFLAEKALKTGYILNSVKTELQFEFEISAE